MDFGYGWRLGIQVQTDVSSTNDVTFTVNGQRRTFYFTPDGSIFGYYTPKFTAEPGFYDKLTATNDNCSGILIRIGNIYQCGISNSGSYMANGCTSVISPPLMSNLMLMAACTRIVGPTASNNGALTYGLDPLRCRWRWSEEGRANAG